MVQNSSAVSDSRKKVVAVRFSALGDVAMTLPELYSAAVTNPDTDFVLLTRPLFCKFAVNTPPNLRVVGIDLNGKYKGIPGMMKLASEIVSDYKADVLLDMHDVLRTKMLRFFTRLRGVGSVVIDKGRADKKRLVAQDNKVFRQLEPMTSRYADVLRSAGIEPGDAFRSVFDTTPADPSLFAGVAVPDDKEIWVGIAPFAKHLGKVYPPEKMEKVVSRLSENPAVRIFLFGGGDSEIAGLKKWERKYPRTVSLADKKLGFAAELALMAHLKVMVSMDSGNMHLASLAGCPVVSVWGATHPYAGFMGFGQQQEDAVQLTLDCRPCSVFGDKPCRFGDYRCMGGIPEDTIFAAVMKKIAI